MGYKGVVLLSSVLLASYISSFDGRNPVDSYWDIKLWNLSILSNFMSERSLGLENIGPLNIINFKIHFFPHVSSIYSSLNTLY